MSTLMPGLGQRREDRRDRARPVGDPGQRDPRLVPVGGDAGDGVAFHVIVLKSRRRRRSSVPGMSSNEDSTRSGMLSRMARPTERVCSTLAPTAASSSISS